MHASPQKHKSQSDDPAKAISANVQTNERADDEASQDAELSKIRELLFGEQVRETEQKQSELETRINRSIGQLRTEVLQHLDMLTKELKQNFSVLEKSLQSESHARGQQVDAIDKRITCTNESIATLAEKSEAAQRALNERIGREAERINDELRSQKSATDSQIQSLAQELRDNKADRNVLAELLSNMSSRLMNDKTT